MKTTARFNWFAALIGSAILATAAEEPLLSFRHSNGSLELSWPATMTATNGSTMRPYFELQRSTDLRQWQPVGERVRAALGTPGQSLSMSVVTGEPLGLYRLLSIPPPTT